ncbi:MAG: YybH family protein [Pyrinomonadaceae bacterium]
MTTATSKAMEEGQIRKLMDERVEAVRTRDVNASIAHLAPDILSFDVVNPLQHVGSDASRKRAEEWFSSFEGPIGYEIRDLSITAGGDVAFAHGLSHVSATRIDGGQLDMWWRTTVCFRKSDGKVDAHA